MNPEGRSLFYWTRPLRPTLLAQLNFVAQGAHIWVYFMEDYQHSWEIWLDRERERERARAEEAVRTSLNLIHSFHVKRSFREYPEGQEQRIPKILESGSHDR